MSALRLVAWNIRQGGGSRLPAIGAALARHEADVLVISEYRSGDSAERTLPFAQRLLTSFPGFILIQQPLQAANCIIIAALLFGQYSITRTPSLNLLAAGYLFTALMIIAHTLSFPGAFSETGLLPGGVQTTSWLYPAWHTILPMTIIVYTLLPSDQTAERRFAGARYPIVASILLCVGGAVAITFFITAARDRPPALVEGGRLLPAATVVITALLFLPFAALIALALRRPRSILDLWLVVTMFTWLCTISLVALVSADRFDIGWYVGRVLDLLTSTFILLLLLSETLVLYQRHAIASAAERRERERRLRETESILVHLSRVHELGHNVTSIVHEVNQPLTAISNYAAASLKLLETSKPERLKILLERLIEQTVRATEIIRHLRDFIARHESERRVENIPTLLRHATRLALDAAGEHAPVERSAACPHPFDKIDFRQHDRGKYYCVNGIARQVKDNLLDLHRVNKSRRSIRFASYLNRGHRAGHLARHPSDIVRTIRHDERKRLGNWAFHLPCYRRGAWRQANGRG